jgi:hypothetical protein
MTSIRSFLVLSFVSSIVVAGCSGADVAGLDSSESAGPEHVAQTSEALCSDTSLAPNATLAIPGPGNSVSSTSPSANYGTGTCPGAYVVDFTGTKAANFTLDATWGPASKLPTSKAACPFAVVSATAYGEVAAHWIKTSSGFVFVPAQWVQLGQPQSAGGKWTDPVPPGQPQLIPVGCSIDLNMSTPQASLYTRVRVAAKATGFAIIAAVPEQVSVGAWTPAIIQ